MEKEVMNEVWKDMMQYERTGARPTLLQYVRSIKRHKPDVSYQECLTVVAERFLSRYDENPFCPESFGNLCSTFLDQLKPQHVFVPFADGAELKFFSDTKAKVKYRFLNSENEEVAREFYDFESTQLIDGEYDLVVANLPIEPIGPSSISCKTVEECIDLLSDYGYGVFTFSKGLTVASGRRWIENLGHKGLFCNAIMDMPARSYEPVTSVDTVVAVFSKKKTEKLFVSLLEDSDIIKKSVSNFLLGKPSVASPKMGIYVDEGIWSFAKYIELRKIERATESIRKKYNGVCVCISELGKIIPCSRGNIEEKDNAVYIPRFAYSPAVLRVEDYQIKPNNYYQILVNEDRMLPRFMLFFLNSEEGRNLRQLHSDGATIPAINGESLGKIKVPCPPKEIQSAYLETYARLESLRIEVDAIKDKFVKTPASYKNILKEIKNINNQGDRFLQWIESLPYPIATILKRFSVLDDPLKQQETLFYFFEAYAIFESSILSAGLDKRLVDCASLTNVDPNYFEKASFGNWVVMDRELSKLYRDMANSKEIEMRRIPLDCFRTSDENIVSLLTNRAVCSILDEASQKRNYWKGHSGIASDVSCKEHVNYLTDLLRKLQENIKDLYERIRLVRLVNMDYMDERFINRVEVLTGSNAYFSKETITTLSPMDKRKLYLYMTDSDEILELPPYFILKNSPADVKNACYFYSRIESGKTRYVSYHYEGRPEDIENGAEAFETIKRLLSR